MQVVKIDEGRLCFNLFDKKSGKLLDSSVYTNYATANMEKVDMLVNYLEKNKIDIESLKKTGGNVVRMVDNYQG